MNPFLKTTLFLFTISIAVGLCFGLFFALIAGQSFGEIFWAIALSAAGIFFVGLFGFFAYKNYASSFGMFVGLIIILGISIYGIGWFIKNSDEQRLSYTFKAISVVGALLTASMVIGKKRLERWGENLNILSSSASIWANSIPERIHKFAWALFWIWAVNAVMFLLIQVFPNFIPENMMLFIMQLFIGISGLLGLVSFLAPISAGLFWVPVLLLLFPFRISSKIENNDVIERGLTLIGLIFVVVGIVFG